MISMSLKSAKQPNYEMTYTLLCRQIAEEYRHHEYVLRGDVLSEAEKHRYQLIMDLERDEKLYVYSLKFLSGCLKRYHGSNVIILVDEYDVPLENAFFKGFYEQMTDFIRSLFESALKTNDQLKFAIVTGCLRINSDAPSSLGSKTPRQAFKARVFSRA